MTYLIKKTKNKKTRNSMGYMYILPLCVLFCLLCAFWLTLCVSRREPFVQSVLLSGSL